MNPSHFPQVIRARSRSPSPVSRRRVANDAKARSTLTPHRTRSFGSRPQADDPRSSSGKLTSYEATCCRPEAHRQFLTVPHAHSGADDSNKKTRSFSHNDCSRPGRTSERSHKELSEMASVEGVSAAHHSINNADHPPAEVLSVPPQDSDDPGNDPNPPPLSHRTPMDCFSEPGRPATNGGPGVGRLPRPRPQRKKKTGWTEEQVEQHRRWLKFFFMDPFNKFKARRHIPWKMCLQFLKIVIITVQLIQFGGQRSDIVEYFEHNQKTLKHLLLKDWDPGYETMPYPPATGVYALYTVNDLLDSIQFAWSQYYNLSQTSLATISLLREHDSDNGTIVPIRLCNSLNNYKTYPNGSYVVGPGVLHNCTQLVPLTGKDPYNIREFLVEHNITVPFRKLLELTLDFSFNTFHLNLMDTHYGPICYKVHTTILFQNYERSGQVLIDLSSTSTQRECSGKIMSPDAKEEEDEMRRRSVGFDAFVIAVCILSSVLCLRSLFRAWKLKRITEKLFKERYGVKLVLSDRMEFVNFWYLLIIINDIFTIIGASYKIQLETRAVSITSSNYDACSVMLGLGGLLAWIGILRYLSFFRKYNILIVTLKTAFPNVLRFSLCALAMYCGFMFCGWLILSPYHIKFRHLSTTSECLFSLVNGDDMFVTFTATESNNLLVWYFSRIYLYTFISLFIYCVLSLFIAVIMDTYETIKQGYNAECSANTELWRFIEECHHPVHSGLYRRRHTEDQTARDWSLIDLLSNMCCRGRKREKAEEGENRPLLTQTI